ncbi:hypothetical protein F5Y10DRAFT_264850 [Nemania abortiva]|nr:hypothetical protein F5Y10DRAFT_264850 [Nemania abortiva]
MSFRIFIKSLERLPWPCIGEFWFVEQGFLRHPDYPRILERITSTTSAPRFLDLGTCLGQDVRTLLHNGASPSTIYGADVLPGFKDAGHALFKDRDRFDESHFITGDIFSEDDELAKTKGTWDIVHIAMFLHVFSLADQEVVSKNVLKLLKVVPGSTVIGTQTGSLDSGVLKLQPPFASQNAAEALGIKVIVWTAYDEDEAKERAAGRMEKGEGWEKKERFFTGERERRIFFRIDYV